MFWTRFLSAVIIVVIAAAVLFAGGTITCAAMCILSLMGIYELLMVYKLQKSALAVPTYLGTIIYYVVLYLGYTDALMPICVVYLLVVLAIYVCTYPKFKDINVMVAFTSFFYVSVMLSYVYRIRAMEHGILLILLLALCSWGNDTVAYLVGVSIGKHKMFPVLSPKKSVEGFIGGLLGSGILGAVFGIIFNNHIKAMPYAVWIFAAIGLIGALPAVIGDLAASAIKRNNEIKDYSNLIPGHGGIMDRFDSMIFTAPIIFYGLQLFLG